MTPEALARIQIDQLLQAAGWQVHDLKHANIHATTGVAIREFPLNTGHGFADYLLYVNGKACGVIEAKKEGATLKGVEVQSGRYAQGLPAALPAWRRPLPFLFESTGVETQFTNGLDPQPRSRGVFAFFRPEQLQQWLLTAAPASPNLVAVGTQSTNEEPPAAYAPTGTFLARMQHLPELVTQWGQGGASYQLWPAQIKAVHNLEKSLAANKPKALIQMATGSGKTFTAISFIYRLIKFGGARRVLFLVDRGNLGRQTKKEFDQYASPYNSFKFGEEFIVQHLQGSQVDTSARVVICTIQRMFSLLKGKALPPEADEESTEELESLFKDPEPLRYNPAFPIELFDIVVTDEAHRSIYNLWRQVLAMAQPSVAHRPELQQTGVYLLLAPREDGEGDRLYIGEGDPIKPRLTAHDKGNAEKSFWTRAICFVSMGQALNKAHAQFSEANLIRLAKQAKNVPLDVENRKNETEPTLSEADRADMQVFLQHMLDMLPVLGVHAFEQPPAGPAPNVPELTCKGKGLVARGYESTQGFVVKAGSQVAGQVVPSMAEHLPGMMAKRQELIDLGVLAQQGNDYAFTQDYTFSSPSTAASVVLGRSANGRLDWKDAQERALKMLQENESA